MAGFSMRIRWRVDLCSSPSRPARTLRLVECFRRFDKDALDYQFTVEDTTTSSGPGPRQTRCPDSTVRFSTTVATKDMTGFRAF